MRRWKLTALLALCAAVAALLAPRLFGAVTPTAPEISTIPEVVVAPLAIPEITTPAVPLTPVAVPPTPALPPEPPVRPAVPDAFWIDAVDCGMG